MVVPAGIFRAYDIRGVVDKDLDADIVEAIGRAFGTLVRREGGRRVLVGRDGRLTSPEMAAAFTRGANAAGCDVLDAGPVPTPMLYFGIRHLDADGGVVITASHNPAEYNGVKSVLGKRTLFGEDIQQIRQMIETEDFETGEGTVESVDLIEPYVAMVKERVTLERPVKVIIDAGNGIAGMIAPRLYRELGCEVEELYCEVDGNFPNHHPDPTVPEAVEELAERVLAGGFDLGLGFDGDGDRVGVIDESGEIVWGDRLTILLARDMLSRNPGATVIFDVKCSTVLADDIAAHGGRPLMWKTGHSFIKQKIREEKALLAGEMSGHLFFGENFYGHDDAVYAGAKLMEIYSRQAGPFSAQLDGLPETFSTPEIRHHSSEEHKFVICERLRDELAAEYDVVAIDGVRVEFPDGWGLARASNTGPHIILRFEAQTEPRLHEIRELVESKLSRIESELSD
ncbi:MAG: phosphomannomutase [Acidobacteria bacterium]|nr:phosphomannomutase [Acidobacteriota bacterium]